MRVAFFTPRSIHPLHPRLISFSDYFKTKHIDVEFINMSGYKPTLASRVSWLYLWFFDLHAINLCKPLVKNYDIIFITDLKYLPLAKYAHSLNKIVIYDTIDHNVDLRFYQLAGKFKFFLPLKKSIIAYFRKLELRYAFRYCHEIIVNSTSLKTYFENKAHALFYSSPFEKTKHINSSSLPCALLYLGIFSPEKGALEILALQKKLNFPLFIFGDISTPMLQDLVRTAPNVHHTSKISVSALDAELKKLLANYYLVGFSLIKAAHFSYEVQEANKDIDYLALGVPLIGNYRLPTREKIDAGCGLFFDDINIAEKLNNQNLKDQLTKTCQQYYDQYYAARHFHDGVAGIIDRYLK